MMLYREHIILIISKLVKYLINVIQKQQVELSLFI